MLHHIRPRMLLFTVFALALTGAAPALPRARAAGLWYVSPDGSNTNSCSAPAAPCATLNGVIAKAADGDTIHAAAGTYRDSGPEAVLVNKSVTLVGGWENDFAAQTGMSFIDGQLQRRSVTIPDGVTAALERFTIHGGVDPDGPGINNAGTLTLTDSEINANWNSGGIGPHAGGLYNSGTATLNRTSVYGNTSYSAPGGGIYNAGRLTLNASTVIQNLGAAGGGLATSSRFPVVINNSTVISNTTYREGGAGIFVGPEHTALDSPVYINNSTITGNRAGYWYGYSGGRYFGGLSATSAVILRNSLVAGNSADYGPDCGNELTSAGHNLIGNTAGCSFTAQPSDVLNVAARLGVPAGLPVYLPLLTGSPALNAGDPAGCRDQAGVPFTADIRGMARPQGAACDIGAYEAELADLSLVILEAAGPRVVGEARPHTVLITNAGPSAADLVTFTEALAAPAAFELNPSQGACPLTGPTARCDLGRLEPGAQVTVTVIMTITQSQSTTVSFTGTAIAARAADPAAANNTVTVTLPISAADLSVAAAAAPDPAVFGAPLTYTLAVANAGPSPAAGVRLTDTLPLSATLLSAEAGLGSCAGAGGVVTCALGDLAAGASQPITLTVIPGQRGALEQINRVSVTSDMPLPAGAASVGVTTTTPVASADVGIVLDEPAGQIERGKPLTYTLTVLNTGPAAATGLQVAFPWPATFSLLQTDFGPGACALNGTSLDCTLDTLAPSASAAATVVVTPLWGGYRPVTATVTANEPDPDPADNAVSRITEITPLGLFMPLVNNFACDNFADAFNNSQSGWTVFEDELRLQGYAGGEYQLMSKQAGYLFYATAPACPRANFAAGVDVRWQGEPGAFYGLRFGSALDLSTYYLFLVNTDYRLYTLVVRSPAGFSDVIPLAPAGTLWADRQAVNRLEVKQFGGIMTFYINGSPVTSHYLGQLGLARFGLVVSPYDDGPVADGRFDNFYLRTLTQAFAQAAHGPAPAPAAIPERLQAWQPPAASEPPVR